MIQGSINQLLSLAAVFAGMDPGSKKRAQVRQTKNQLKVLDKEVAALGDLTDMREGEAKHTTYREIQSSKAEVLKQLFSLDPSSETFKSYKEAKSESGAKGYADIVLPADPEEIEQERRESARELAAKRAEADRQAAEELRQEELAKVRTALQANAPTPTTGKKETIKYDNI